MNIPYEPPPAWGCNHYWIDVGEPYLVYYSNNTGDKCPDDVPYHQKQKCIHCNGFQTILKSRF